MAKGGYNNSNVLNKQSGTGSMGKIIFIIFILLIVEWICIGHFLEYVKNIN